MCFLDGYVCTNFTYINEQKKLKMMEDLLIRKIKGGINAIKGGRKSPQESGVGAYINKLKTMNVMMYEDLLNDFQHAIKKYNDSKL